MWHGLRLTNELGVSDCFRHLAKDALSISRRVAPIAGEPRALIMLHTAKKVCEPFHTRVFVPSRNAIEVGDAASEGLGRTVGLPISLQLR